MTCKRARSILAYEGRSVKSVSIIGGDTESNGKGNDSGTATPESGRRDGRINHTPDPI
jgi:hypothetical protein